MCHFYMEKYFLLFSVIYHLYQHLFHLISIKTNKSNMNERMNGMDGWLVDLAGLPCYIHVIPIEIKRFQLE